jgi:hypothetical protein
MDVLGPPDHSLSLSPTRHCFAFSEKWLQKVRYRIHERFFICRE